MKHTVAQVYDISYHFMQDCTAAYSSQSFPNIILNQYFETISNFRTLCCADARNQCGIWCGEKPCEETCTYYCGPFNTNCGTWTCEEVAGFSCKRTTTTTPPTPAPATTAATCAATGATCLDLADAKIRKNCCLTTDTCKVSAADPTKYTCQV